MGKLRHLQTWKWPYSCSKCDKKFASTGEKPYGIECEGKCSRHELTHPGEKPHSCNKWDETFTSIGKKHVLIHSGEKPYSCTECDKECGLHELTHSGEKPYSCSKGDKNSDNMGKKHVLTHSGEKLYSCSECDKKCEQNELSNPFRRKALPLQTWLQQLNLIYLSPNLSATTENSWLCFVCPQTCLQQLKTAHFIFHHKVYL